MEELFEKLNLTLNSINESFDISIDDKNSDEIITKLSIKSLKNDGSDFIEKFCSLFGPLIEQLSDGKKELLYQENTGLVIKRKED